MRMVSQSWSIAEQSKHTISRNLFVNEDGVPSWSWHQKYEREFLVMSANLQMQQSLVPRDPDHGTRNMRGNFSKFMSVLQSSSELAHARDM